MAARSPRRPVSVGPTQERREWTIASDVQAITPIVETIQALCAAAGFSPRQCRLNIPVAITEALSNAILRGNASDAARHVRVRVALEGSRLLVDVIDEGAGFDVQAAQRQPDQPDWLEREDGRGYFLMRSLMDQVESRMADTDGRHTLRLILHRT